MSLGKKVADIRKDYLQGSLDLDQVAADPFAQFEDWFEAAVKSEVIEPNAMTLATVREGRPSARIVLLKGFDERGFVFFTNYRSRKGQEMADNPMAALTFFWPELERQVRIEGSISLASAEESDTYYHSRGRGSRIGAWASPQSEELPDRDTLEKSVAAIEARFAGEESIPRPEFWGGYRLAPDYVEFWQGRKSRLHDRIVYTRGAGGWGTKRIAP
ncbi:MAG: pyridoxamine 5'-phosphate oxidase [Bacteroidota bacterium]